MKEKKKEKLDLQEEFVLVLELKGIYSGASNIWEIFG